MNKYPKYKPSNIPWIGDVPEHWEVISNRRIFFERKEYNDDEKAELLSVSQYTGVTKKQEATVKTGMHDAESLVGYRIVRKGDFVMNYMLAWNGSMGISQYDGVTSPAYAVFKIKDRINKWYLHYLLRTPFMNQYFEAFSTGMVKSRLRLYPDNFKSLFSFIPPPEEQTQIVQYLDEKLEKLTKLTNAKKKQITLLKEQKQAIINEAVTKGIWKKLPLKRLLIEPLQYGANDSGVAFCADLPRYVRITDISPNGNLKDDDIKSLTNEVARQYLLSEGDILLARSGATAGKSFMFESKYGICAFAGYLIKAKFDKKKLLPKFFIHYTNSSIYEEWKDSIFIQATI